MAACWRALACQGDWDVHVVASLSGDNTAYSLETMRGITWYERPEDAGARRKLVRALLNKLKPAAVTVGGWAGLGYLAEAAARRRTSILIIAVDNPYTGRLRQQWGRLLLRWLPRVFDVIAVPGERGVQYALRLGFTWDRIVTPLYGIDFESFSEAKLPWSDRARRFVFAGRYVEEKGISVLLQAYEKYRSLVPDPWELRTCGKGPLVEKLRSTPGVTEAGFVQPHDLPKELGEARAFVLPSLHDNWGVAIVEACAAGLPVIATRTCGSTVECVRHGWNGFLVAPGDAEALAHAMSQMHLASNSEEMSRRSFHMAGPYSAQNWASEWSKFLRASLEGRTYRIEERSFNKCGADFENTEAI